MSRAGFQPHWRAAGLLSLAVALGGGAMEASLAAPAPAAGPPPQHLPVEGYWCPGGERAALPAGGAGRTEAARVPAGCVALEVPRTLRQYVFGLQLRGPLPPDRGMWFAYRPARPARFWMHRTPEPLDLIFVRQQRVVAIETAAAPCLALPCPSYGPAEPVDGVLELAAGEARRRGLRPGSPLRVQLLVPLGPVAPAPD